MTEVEQEWDSWGAGNILFRDMGDGLTVVQFVKISTMPCSVF